MPGPAITVSVLGDTSDLDAKLEGPSGIGAKISGGIQGIASKAGAIALVLSMVGEAVGGIAKMAGPETEAAVASLSKTVGDALAPAFAKLGPPLVHMVDLLTKLLIWIMPGLIAIIDIVAGAFDLVAQGIQAASDLIAGAVDLIVTSIKNAQKLLQDLQAAMPDIFGAIDAQMERLNSFKLPWETGGMFGAPAGAGHGGNRTSGDFRSGGMSITVNTGADPGSVSRAMRRYAGANGGARAASASLLGVRGH